MSLTQEQVEIRRTGIGASETSAILEINPYSGPIDVWLEKLGRVVRPSEETLPTQIGSALESGLLDLFAEKTGVKMVSPKRTYRHPEFARVLASPDGLPEDAVQVLETGVEIIGPVKRGGEIKIVGARMAHHWAEDRIPEYVISQCDQNMAVFGADEWYVIALIGGTDLRIEKVLRDEERELRIIEAVETFWIEYVETESPPPAKDPDQMRRYLLERYPGSELTTKRVVGDGDHGEIAEIVRWLSSAKALRKELERAEAQLENALCELVADDYGVTGPWGSFLHYPRAGSVSWKAVAEELAGGAVPQALIDKHRGKPTRVPLLSPPSKALTRRGSKR